MKKKKSSTPSKRSVHFYKKLFERGIEMIKSDMIPQELSFEILDEYSKKFESFPDHEKYYTELQQEGVNKKDRIKALILLGAQAALLDEKSRIQKELDKTMQSYEEILGLITHEFKNLLTTAQGYNRLLRKNIDSGSKVDLEDNLNANDRIMHKLFNIVDALLKMSLTEKKLLKPSYKLINFKVDIIETVAKEFEVQLNDKVMKLDVQVKCDKVMLMADQDLLEIVMRNLIDNAIKYGARDTVITIVLERNEEYMYISVQNIGYDIPENICSLIFKKFRTIPIGSVTGGLGIGLYNVKNIINLHGGTITCNTKSKKWIIFKFSLPCNMPEPKSNFN
jgi:signal transduction histidine kinase